MSKTKKIHWINSSPNYEAAKICGINTAVMKLDDGFWYAKHSTEMQLIPANNIEEARKMAVDIVVSILVEYLRAVIEGKPSLHIERDGKIECYLYPTYINGSGSFAVRVYKKNGEQCIEIMDTVYRLDISTRQFVLNKLRQLIGYAEQGLTERVDSIETGDWVIVEKAKRINECFVADTLKAPNGEMRYLITKDGDTLVWFNADELQANE